MQFRNLIKILLKAFDSKLGLNPRTGTHKDAEKMFRIAEHMGFEFVRIFNNLKKSEIFDWLKAGEYS